MNTRKILFIFLLTLLIAPHHGAFAGKLYKWVDEHGNIHFGDQVPASNIENEHSQLSNTGRELEKFDKQRSKEERQREKQLREQREAELARKAAEQKRLVQQQQTYDHLLLQTYVSEKDLIIMRDRQIATIEGTITLTQSNINKLSAQLEKLKKEADGADPTSKRGQRTLSELQMTQNQLKEYSEFIERRRSEQSKLKNQFNRDLKRLRELLSQN